MPSLKRITFAPVLVAAFLLFMPACANEESAETTEETPTAAQPAGQSRAESTQTAQTTAPAPPPESTIDPKGRVIILGFDGVEPSIVSTMMDNGELPNLTKLRDTGTYTPLGSTNPPQSPTAWSSFATCTDAGDHGIYDFIKRNPKTYFPAVGFGTIEHPKLAPDGSVHEAAHGVNFRKGETFWDVADEQGAACKILSMPFAFPPDDLHRGAMLSGLGVTDVRGTQSTFVSLATNFTPEELDDSPSGGMRIPIEFEGDNATVSIPVARDPRQRRATYVEAPIALTKTGEGRLTIDVQGTEQTLNKGEWSDWFEWNVPVTDQYAVAAISRFYVMESGEDVRLYMTCLQFHPENPYIPFTTPAEYSAELAERYGLFKTIGWAYDTHALRQDAMNEEMFLEDIYRTMAWREQLTLDELDRGEFDMLVSVWTATDRVGHMFWHHRDEKHPLYTKAGADKYGRVVEDTYKKMDEIVGKVMAKLDEDDLFMIMSDHGFHSFRRGFNVNTWLIREGYLAVKGANNPATAYTNSRYLQGFDWPKTQAYSLGLGSIFLNLQGRERDGVVAPADVEAVVAEIREKLLAVVDPETGDNVFSEVYAGADVFEGISSGDAPDIQLGYAEGYQSTKAAAAGAAPADLFEDNDDKWSGEHASSDIATTPGIFFSNRNVEGQPTLLDLGMTALNHLGAEIPEAFEGKVLNYN